MKIIVSDKNGGIDKIARRDRNIRTNTGLYFKTESAKGGDTEIN